MSEPRTIAYLRVSTREQSTDRQAYGLRDLCDEFHIEYLSAGARHRPVFEATIARLNPGDTFLVWDLDRAFRSTIDALITADQLRARGIHLRIAQMSFDTATEEGELFYTLIAAFARFERRILARRTREGLAAAKANGKRLGRPRKLDKETVHLAHKDIAENGYPCRYVAHLLGVSRITLQRAIRREGLA
ncbi:recombinase family protein [Leisingera sp. M658]|uniref:recombinase family protein n=1 Tax=Leisingera sp. M658 TaxID=2867015 RepID=UPI0021A87624|nr:recombinase family protein [Leisingera sp. M658]UWQ73604.1 recombinase family protein [Leisingera sp. M658]